MGGDLSGGQQQQQAIAKAPMGNPHLLLLDEPTEGMQASIILEIEAAVTQILQTRGISVLLIERHLHFYVKLMGTMPCKQVGLWPQNRQSR